MLIHALLDIFEYLICMVHLVAVSFENLHKTSRRINTTLLQIIVHHLTVIFACLVIASCLNHGFHYQSLPLIKWIRLDRICAKLFKLLKALFPSQYTGSFIYTFDKHFVIASRLLRYPCFARVRCQKFPLIKVKCFHIKFKLPVLYFGSFICSSPAVCIIPICIIYALMYF